MANKTKVTVIGAGDMGGAFASALSENELLQVSVYDVYAPAAENLAKDKAITVLKKMEDAVDQDIVIIAVKPQTLPSVYDSIRALDAKLYISIAAGVTLKKLQENLKTDRIVRFMPNIAAKVKSAVTAVAFSSSATEAVKEEAMMIANSVGSAFELDEKLFSTFIGISGSGIAYMYEFMHQMAMGGVRGGIPYQKSLSIVADTMLSAVNLQKSTGKGAIELETMVCSPKGTTIEGVIALQDGA
ncbi:MAG: pyrroline-5-carboxylate reductase, partial [Spirochaetales bacterium]|nr:pyrroline-5-carboxylate reductase [Candidatus Physcosoma equi]